MTVNKISFSEIKKELSTLCEQSQSGRYIILANASGQFLSFGLKAGRIVAVKYGSSRGMEALNEARAQIKSGQPYFMPSVSTEKDDAALPPTERILEFLGGLTTSTSRRVSQETIDMLEQVLVEVIGPMGKSLCNKTLPTVNDVDSAINALADGIPDQEKASAFKLAVRSRL